jgi:hypothetical protein
MADEYHGTDEERDSNDSGDPEAPIILASDSDPTRPDKYNATGKTEPSVNHIPDGPRAIFPPIWRVLKSASFWTAVGTIAIAVTSFYQWRAIKGQLGEMQSSGTQTDKLICAANQIEEHQKQLVADNKQGLLDNRNALSASLEENRSELSNALRENRDALKAQTAAANGELAEIQKQTEISERPWLSVEATQVNGLFFVNGEQAVLKLKVSIKNVGKSIAKDVQVDAKLFPTAPMPVAIDAGKSQRELCEYPKPEPVGRFDVFPDHPDEREMDISAIPSAIAAQSVAYPGDKVRRFVGFYVVGCVTYHSSFGLELHQTRFAYLLIGPPIISPERKLLILPNGMPLMVGFEVGVDVPQNDMRLMQEIFSRNDAT